MHPLRKAVQRQMGYTAKEKDDFISTLRDVNRGGADAGFGGFTYYKDTIAFYKRNREQILSSLGEMADSLGEGVLEMVASFQCLKSCNLTTSEVAKAIYTGKGECVEQIQNALAWFALEEVAREEDR